MARSPEIILGAATVSFTNEWLQTNKMNFRIPMAGILAALIFDGFEQVNEQAAVGLALIVFLTTMITPFNGTAPAAAIAKLAVAHPGKA